MKVFILYLQDPFQRYIKEIHSAGIITTICYDGGIDLCFAFDI